MIAAEMRQCYERVRPNASVNPETGEHIEKHVYIASAFPCADHVDLLLNWATWWVDHVGLAYYDTQFAQALPVFQDDYIKHVMSKTGCVYNTAKASFKRISAEKEKSNLLTPGGKKKTQREIVLDWLSENPKRAELSSRSIAKELGVRQPTVAEALKVYRGETSLQSQLKINNQECKNVSPEFEDSPSN